MTAPEVTDLETLKAATREAHEATKDLRKAIKEARAVVTEVNQAAAVQVDGRIAVALSAGLETLQESIGTAIDDATGRVNARFDQVADILLGETKKDKRRGNASLPQVAEQIATQKGDPDD